MTSDSPLAMLASSFLVRKAGKGHFRPRRLTVFSAMAAPFLPRFCRRGVAVDCGQGQPRHYSRMASHHPQTIARLAPLSEAVAAIEAQVKPVAASRGAPAAGRVLAEDVAAPRRPEAAIALVDGWAISADDTLGAGGTSPTALSRAPARIDAGQPMPPGTDSIAPLDAVQAT